MAELDFKKIAARGGSVADAFEELCCQLASRSRPAGTKFERYRGAGGDGGIECKVIGPHGSATGWQSKFVFDIDGLLKQAQQSLETALSVHTDLTRYIICFPFDLTGKTARRGKSQTEKFDEWVELVETDAKVKGRTLTIERWSAHNLRDLALSNDSSGGLRHYFFSGTTFSDQWFSNHVALAKQIAGPRYNRKISLETPLSGWFSSFGEGLEWQAQLTKQLNACRKEAVHIDGLIQEKSGNSMRPGWPDAVYDKGKKAAAAIQDCIKSAEVLGITPSELGLSKLQSSISNLLDDLAIIECELAADLDSKHGEGKSDSRPFRSYMAEYMVSFPAANLDAVREARKLWSDFLDWLSSPNGFLAFRQVFVLSGSGGSGKTHSLCDIAQRRLATGAYTCIVFGHQFEGGPDPWTRFTESLGVPHTLGRDGVLDALEAAAISSGKKLVICIDAVNETKPRKYWLDRFAEFAHAVASRSHLKLCVSCRTSFLPVCLPEDFTAQAVEHKGFTGIEREACEEFFSYYGIEPPLIPVLQPELANPLYLKLVCETLQAKGLKQLPNGWSGIAPVIRAFLSDKEDKFAKEHGISAGAAIVGGSLQAITAAIVKAGSAALRWSEAQAAIEVLKPQAKGFEVLQWLITADLLIEDGPSTDTIGAENLVRPAFERFGDFLVAARMLELATPSNVHITFKGTGQFAHLLNASKAILENTGLLSALSVLIPESVAGMELSDLVEDDSLRSEVAAIVVRSLPWRTAETFLPSTRNLLQELLSTPDAYDAMDAMLAVSTQDSKIDAHWLHEVLERQTLSKRDAFWSRYLKQGYEGNNVTRRLIEAAKDLNLQKVEDATAERWCIILVWFSAAADRRVKDAATRAVIAILRCHPALLPSLVSRFLATDDDEVRERTLLVAYGVLINTRDLAVIKEIAEGLLTAYAACPADFDNAIIRDHIRCIAELAEHLECLDKRFDPTLPNRRNSKVPRPRPPAEREEKAWSDEKESGVRLVAHSCLHDDFNHYSIDCMSGWDQVMLKPQIGRWLAKRVIDEFGYRGSGCSSYDAIVTRETGGGRSKPVWAERIGKKYQWVAMYQLASRLYDSAERKKDSWERTTERLPLILMEERKLDPTISRPKRPDQSPTECWWIGGNIDFRLTEHLDPRDWSEYEADLPSMESLLTPKSKNCQRWVPLVCYPSWSDKRETQSTNNLYRFVWIHLNAYLVPDAQFNKARKAISRRNFFGKWMPSGATWLHTFVGEYPWASACNIETDDWLGHSSKVHGSSLTFIPVENEVACEWEYDSSLPESIHFKVPTRAFFEVGDLWWNGQDGFKANNDKTIFMDPSAAEGGPHALLADLDDLLPRLEKLGFRLVWTLLGEKIIVNDHSRTTSPMTFSQTAFLNKNGSVVVGDRVFFEDRNKDQRLAE